MNNTEKLHSSASLVYNRLAQCETFRSKITTAVPSLISNMHTQVLSSFSSYFMDGGCLVHRGLWLGLDRIQSITQMIS